MDRIARNATSKRIAKPIVPIGVSLAANPTPFVSAQRTFEVVSFPWSCLFLPAFWTKCEIGPLKISLEILITSQICVVLVMTLETDLLGAFFTLDIFVLEIACSRNSLTICIWTLSNQRILYLFSLIFKKHQFFNDSRLIDIKQLQLFISWFALASGHKTLNLAYISDQNFLFQLISRTQETKGVTAIKAKSLRWIINPNGLLTAEATLLYGFFTKLAYKIAFQI